MLVLASSSWCVGFSIECNWDAIGAPNSWIHSWHGGSSSLWASAAFYWTFGHAVCYSTIHPLIGNVPKLLHMLLIFWPGPIHTYGRKFQHFTHTMCVSFLYSQSYKNPTKHPNMPKASRQPAHDNLDLGIFSDAQQFLGWTFAILRWPQ